MSATHKSDDALILRLLTERDLFGGRAREDVARMIAVHPGTIEEALAASGLVDERAIAEGYGEYLGIPWIDLVRDPSQAHAENADLRVHVFRAGAEPKNIGVARGVAESCKPFAELVSDVVCKRCKIAPIGVTQGCLDLACINPANFLVLDEIQLRSGLMVRPHAATPRVVSTLLALFFGANESARGTGADPSPPLPRLAPRAPGASPIHAASAGQATPHAVPQPLPHAATATPGAAAVLPAPMNPGAFEKDEPAALVDLQKRSTICKDDHVARALGLILRGAADQHASDVHLEPCESSVRVRYRVDGDLVEVGPPAPAMFLLAIARLKTLARLDAAETRAPQSGSFAVTHDGRRMQFHVNTAPTVHGEKVVVRLTESATSSATLEDLGFEADDARAFLDAARSQQGLILVAGPAGSGKTTTIYTCLQLVNDAKRNIATIEDPIERRIAGTNQIQVGRSTGLDFTSALRVCLRQDADVVFVGEMRDRAIADTCARAAASGRVVISALDASSALEAVQHLASLGIEPIVLARALRFVVSQRLVRRLCRDCKQAIEIAPDVAASHGLDASARIFAPASGTCVKCRGTGYYGSVGLFEVVPIGDALRELIERRAPQSELRASASAHGARFLADAARAKLIAGETSLDEIAVYLRTSAKT